MKLIQFWYFDWKLIYMIYSSYLGHFNYQWTSNCFMNYLPVKMNENKIIEIFVGYLKIYFDIKILINEQSCIHGQMNWDF